MRWSGRRGSEAARRLPDCGAESREREQPLDRSRFLS